MYSGKRLWLVAWLALTVFVVSASATAGIPRKINYQARLTDLVTGEPRVGSFNMTFRLFDAASEGIELWSESHVAVAGSAGVVGLILGSTVPIDVAFDGPTWLEVEVMGEVLSPRRELVSVPYAFRALTTDSLGDHGAGDFILKGELSSITADMIVGGTGTGLDADMLDGLNADAFAGSLHTHDERYYTQDSLTTPGEVNDPANPVDWSKLKGVPADFADGTDDEGGAGDGYSLDAEDGDPVDVVYVDSSGRVGIGTTTPAEPLHVDGAVEMTGFKLPTGAANGHVLTSDAGGTGTWQPAAVGDGYSLDAEDGDPANALYVNAAGRVGIGTLNPVDRLHVNLPNIGDACLRFTNNTTGTTLNDGFRVGIDEDGDVSLWSYETRYFSIGTGNVERLRITTAGDVGIGTYDPQADLHVHEGGIGGCYLALTNTGTGYVGDNGLIMGIATDGTTLIGNKENNQMLFETNGNIGMTLSADSRLAIGGLTGFSDNLHVATTSPSETCYVRLTNGGTGHHTTDGLMMRIAPNGNAALLNRENGLLGIGTGSEPDITIHTNGDVGIGAPYPFSRLHLYQPTAGQPCTELFTNAATGNIANDGLLIGMDSGGYALIHNFENTSLRFGTNNLERMIIAANGNVGIGDDEPAVKLAVNGVARIQHLPSWPTVGEGMELAYDAGLDRGYIQVYDRDGAEWGTLSLGSGNVGIGTNSPSHQLEVKGADPFLGLNTTVNKTGLKLQKNGTTEWEVAWNEGSGYLYFYNAGTRLVMEDATGDVGIGTSTPAYKLQVGNEGDGTEARANEWNTFSTSQAKSDIQKLEAGECRQILEEARKTDVVRYIDRGDETRTEHLGLIAEDAPDLVATPDREAIELAGYASFLLAAIKAQQEQIDALQVEVKLLRDRLETR
jgi:hypothetical protein